MTTYRTRQCSKAFSGCESRFGGLVGALLLGIVLTAIGSDTASATTIVDGSVATGSPVFKTLSGAAYLNPWGTYSENAIVYGVPAAGTNYAPVFAKNWIVTNSNNVSVNLYNVNLGSGSSNETSVDWNTITFSDIPVVTQNGRKYFVLSYDSQETGAGRDVSVDFIEVRTNVTSLSYNSTTNTVSGGNLAWKTTDTISLNSQTPYTSNPLGNSEDMVLYIPVRAFDGLGLTGASTLALVVKQSRGDNGGDEWSKISALGTTGVPTLTTFLTTDVISSGEPVVTPEPATVVVTGAALVIAAFLRRRSAQRSAMSSAE